MKRFTISLLGLCVCLLTIAAIVPPAAFDDLVGQAKLFTVYDGKLVVGGYFKSADRRPANNIALWDGAKWSTLKKGVDAIPKDLCVVGKELYACGDWSYVDKEDNSKYVEAGQVAKWDGMKWSSLAKKNVVDQKVWALATDGKNLYIGGRFTKVDDKLEASNLAVWDGKKLSVLGNQKFQGDGGRGIGTILAMAHHDGKLFVGGVFGTIGDEPASRAAFWDGKSWTEAGNKGLNNQVTLLKSDGKTLYAAGKFTAAGDGTPLKGVAKWDNGKWSPLGNDGLNDVTGLAIDGNTVYIANGQEVIKKWDGSSWSDLPAISMANLYSVGVYNGVVYAGGEFNDGKFGGICKLVNGTWEAVSK